MSNQIKIYRLEVPVEYGDHTSYYGPFTAHCHNKELTKVCNGYKDSLGWVKEPSEEGIMGMHIGHVVGIHKASLVRHWFTFQNVMKNLFDAGFTLAVYSVREDKVKCGETQCAFHPDSATLIERLDFDQAFEYGYGRRRKSRSESKCVEI